MAQKPVYLNQIEARSGSRPVSESRRRAAPARDLLPLVVDLDGTLLRTDLLVEGMLALIRRNVLMVVSLLVWMVRGKAYLKRQVAQRANLDILLLPANEDLLAYIRLEKARGRRIILATAADELLAHRVAQRFDDLFDAVIASDGILNLKGEAKAAKLRAMFPQGFHYAGDSRADLPVWQAADHIILVECRKEVARAALALKKPVTSFAAASIGRALLKGLRLHQWAKNALIFVPLVLGGKLVSSEAWLASGLAFLALGLVASGTYLLNDLWDLPHDRAHWSKKNRPLASGRLPAPTGLLAIAASLSLGLALALMVSPAVLFGILAYLVITLSYSISLKRVPILDAFMLGVLFTLRLAIGVAATGVAWSPWLLAFSMFLFTSLSFAKRHVEMRGALKAGKTGRIAGRGYESADEPVVLTFGISCGIASIVIFILYLSNEAFRNAAFAEPLALWVFPAILMLWLGRVWILAGREALNDDPVAFAMKDRVSLAMGGVVAIAFVLAVLGLPGGSV